MFSNIENLRFQYEKDLFSKLQSDPLIAHVLASTGAKHHFNSLRRHLLGSAVKITPLLIPDLYSLYQECLDLVGREFKGDLYVQQQSEYNAFVHAVGAHFDIILSSSIVRDFNEKEIAFVIGHELGHVLFGHNTISVKGILAEHKSISYELAYLLFQWSRASEITADRIGILCGGSLSSAATALFKLSSGLSLDREAEIIRSLRFQFDEIKALSLFQSTSNDWVCTHPLVPIRFKSLELITLDILAFRAQKSKTACRGIEAVDAQVAEVLMETEPLGIQKFFPSAQDVSLLVLCLLYMAVSDGPLNEHEENFIHDIRKRSGARLNIEEVIAECKRDVRHFRQTALSDIAAVSVSGDMLVRILQLSYYLAIMDGEFHDSEMQALDEICRALGGESWLVDSVVGQYAAFPALA